MSIIHNALKKAQSNLEKNNKPEPPKEETEVAKNISKLYEKLHHPEGPSTRQGPLPPPEAPNQPPPPPPSPKAPAGKTPGKKFPFRIAYLVFAFAFALAMGASHVIKQPGFSSFLKKEIKNIEKKSPLSFAPSPASTRAAPASHEKSNSSVFFNGPSIVLNGTMMMGERRVALINNHIYEVGEVVDGKKILEIQLDMVKLNDNGKTIVLTTR